MALVKIGSYLDFSKDKQQEYLSKLVATDTFLSRLYKMDQESLFELYTGPDAPIIDPVWTRAIQERKVAFIPVSAKIIIPDIDEDYTMIHLLYTFNSTNFKTHFEDGQVAIMACPRANIPNTEGIDIPYYQSAADIKESLYPESIQFADSETQYLPNLILALLSQSYFKEDVEKPKVKEIISQAREVTLSVPGNVYFPSRYTISKAFIDKNLSPPSEDELNEIFRFPDDKELMSK